MRRVRQHLTYANVISTVCLFLLLGGGTAVALNGTNTVFTDDVADDTRQASGGNPAGGLVAADLRPNSVGSSEVTNDTLSGGGLTAADLKFQSVGSSEVMDGDLKDVDIGDRTLRGDSVTIGTVPAGSCVYRERTGLDALGKHILLTPNFNTTANNLDYGAQYSSATQSVWIVACNPTSAPISDGVTYFDLIVFDTL
jgi:hypothetical protein